MSIVIDLVIKDSEKGLQQLTSDADGLHAIMSENVRISQVFSESLSKMAASSLSFDAIGKSVTTLASTLKGITQESADFAGAMRAANTMAGKDAEGFAALKGEVSELAKSLPVARDELANGLYQVISNGVPEDNWIEFLNASARASVGGIADLGGVVGVTSTMIKNYGLEWSAAADIQDKIQLTAKNGVTSFEQLSQALPRVAGNAATLGVSIDELMATFATLTGVSGNTAEVSTQLAAIFTALVKPSSEATKMAAEMGIQFDAAAIKAAGGMQNFLTSLDSTVKSYAQSSGMLEQEVYGKLFGSAEALRALVPLQGELAAKFEENVGAMQASAGTMSAAYDTMSASGSATVQMLRNQMGALTDVIQVAVSGVQPYLTFGESLASTASGVLAASKAMKTFINTTVTASRALKTLMISSGVGIAIAALTAAIAYFCDSADEAADSATKAAGAIGDLDDASDEYVRAATDAKVTMDREIASLKPLVEAHKEDAEAVRHLNDTYGDIFGSHKTCAEWYDTLIGKSKAYVAQIGYEAQAKALASDIAANDINRSLASKRVGEWEESNPDKMRYHRADLVTGTREAYSIDSEWKSLREVYKGYVDEGKALAEKMETIKKLANEASAEVKQNAKPVTPKTPTGTATSKGKSAATTAKGAAEPKAEFTPIPIEQVKTLAEVGDHVAYYSRMLNEAATDQERLTAQEQINAFTALGDAMRAPLDALKETTAATKEVQPLAIDQITTFDQLSEQVSLYTDRLNKAATAQERLENQKHLNALAALGDAMREPLDALSATTEAISEADTMLRAWGDVKGIAGGIESIAGAFDRGKNAWQTFVSVIDGALQVFQSVASILSIIDTVTTALTATKEAGAAADVASAAATVTTSVAQGEQAVTAGAALAANTALTESNKAAAASALELAAATYYATHAAIPFAGAAIASGFVAAATAGTVGAASAVMALPFAKGGVVSGPTLGLIGEYAGASHNPEVVAPLDRLRQLIKPATDGTELGGRVTFRIDGRSLVGVLDRESTVRRRN